MGKVAFQLNNPSTFTMTTAQLCTMNTLALFAEAENPGVEIECDIVEGDNPRAPHIKFYVNNTSAATIVRYWIDPDGTIGMAEEVTWDGEGE